MEDLENLYGNHNKLVVDKHGRLVYIHWPARKGMPPVDYEVIGVSDKLNFNLRKIQVKR